MNDVPEARVVIADDHAVVRRGLRALVDDEPGLRVVDEAADAEEAVSVTVASEPDVVLVDMRMPGGGVEACRRIAALRPQTRMLVYSSFDDDADVRDALDAGACGYVLKDTPPDMLVRSLKAVLEGGTVLDPRIARRLFGHAAERRGPELSDREREVLTLMARGCKNAEIGKQLWLSESTVKTHVANIIHKLGERDRTQAVLHALREGIVSLGH